MVFSGKIAIKIAIALKLSQKAKVGGALENSGKSVDEFASI